jgi:hypothetical protein
MVAVARVGGGHRLVCDGSLVEFANRWLGHLEARQFSPATVRSYAFEVVCLARFFDEAAIDWPQANPTDFFDWLEWQCRPAATKGRQVGPSLAHHLDRLNVLARRDLCVEL